MSARRDERSASWSAVAFFTGLALLCASAVELGRWPWLLASIEHSDLEPDWLAWRYDFGELAYHLGQQDRTEALLTAILAVLALAALLSVVATMTTAQPEAAEWGLVAACGAGVAVVALALTPLLGEQKGIAAQLGLFLAFLAVACTVCAFSPTVGTPLRTGSVVAGLLALGVIAATAFHSAAAAAAPAKYEWDGVSGPPGRPTGLLVATACAGLAVALWSRARVSGRPALALLLGGLALATPALTIVTDERLVKDRAHVGAIVPPPPRVRFASAARCRSAAQLAPNVSVFEGEVTSSGMVLGSSTAAPGEIEAAVFDRLTDMREQYLDIVAATSEPPPTHWSGRLNFVAEETTPLPIALAVARGFQRSEYRELYLVTVGLAASPLRTRPYNHRHACASAVVIAEDGVPITSFADWSSLVKAADEADEPLRLSPR